MNKISATILTFNEATRIEGCLDSLRDVADEIVVVDSGSTDDTVEICHRHGCRVSQRRMSGFGAQRQYATSLTTYPFVLTIDADEALSPALRQAIINLKKEGITHRGYMAARLNFFCGYAVKHCGWYPDYQVRLFDKRYACWSLTEINEYVVFRDNIVPQLLPGDILHYRCDSTEEYLLRRMKQAEIKAAALAADNSHIDRWTPLCKGLGRFFNSYLRLGGILDGTIGLAISRQNFLAERHAWRHARALSKKS